MPVKNNPLPKLAALILMWASATFASADPIISKPTLVDGVISYTVESEYQNGPNRLDILPPARMEPGKRYPVIYVLPVAKGPDEDRRLWGYGLAAMRGENLFGKPPENLADKFARSASSLSLIPRRGTATIH